MPFLNFEIMAQNYIWSLKRGGKKLICPNCGHKTFVPFVLTKDNETLAGEVFGRCDRENNCGYFCKPDKNSEQKGEPLVYLPPLPPSYIPYKYVSQSERDFNKQTLYRAFREYFSEQQMRNAFKKYHVGTTKSGATIFWQIDINNKVRTGKIMNYLADGHRDKSNFGTWVHKKIGGDDYVLRQCLFGEHLIKKNAKVAIVESEKTAIFCSIIYKDYTWLATGGSGNVQTSKFMELIKNYCSIFFFPDNGCESEWISKVKNIGTVKTSLYDKNDELGIDILDKFIKKYVYV